MAVNNLRPTKSKIIQLFIQISVFDQIRAGLWQNATYPVVFSGFVDLKRSKFIALWRLLMRNYDKYILFFHFVTMQLKVQILLQTSYFT